MPRRLADPAHQRQDAGFPDRWLIPRQRVASTMSGTSRLQVFRVLLSVSLLLGTVLTGDAWSQETNAGEADTAPAAPRPVSAPPGGYLGVDLTDVGSNVARQLRVTSQTGAVVTRVDPKTPAAEVGLEPGDVILELGGQPTPKAAALEAVLRQCTPGNRYVVELVRGQSYMSMLVTLKAVPEKPTGATGLVGAPVVRLVTIDAVLPAIGMRVTSAGTDEAHDLGIETPIGAVITVVQPDSPGAGAGIQRGDLITHVGGREIVCYEDFEALLLAAKPGQRFPVRIARGDKQFLSEIPLGQRDGEIQLYTHPASGYQLRLPVSWSQVPSEPSSPQSSDRFQSWEKHYLLECVSGTRPAPVAEEALDAFVGRWLRQGWANAHRLRVGDDSVAFVSRENEGEPRQLVYRIGLVRRGLLCEFQLYAPIVSNTEALPVVVEQLLMAP